SVKSGIISNTAVAQLNATSAGRPSLSALHTPSGRASIHTRVVAVPVSSSVFRARVQSSGPTGALYANENPKSPRDTAPAHRAERNANGWATHYFARGAINCSEGR